MVIKIVQIVNDDNKNDIHFVQHHKRVLYCPHKHESKNINSHGNLLISCFCASLANNQIKQVNLNQVIQETKKRMKNVHFYDENYIENRYQVTFITAN